MTKNGRAGSILIMSGRPVCIGEFLIGKMNVRAGSTPGSWIGTCYGR